MMSRPIAEIRAVRDRMKELDHWPMPVRSVPAVGAPGTVIISCSRCPAYVVIAPSSGVKMGTRGPGLHAHCLGKK
jgi:hypothetical protein